MVGDKLNELLCLEARLADVARALRQHVRALDAPVVGALHLMCADESEWECGAALQRHFINDLLPDLKFGTKSPFRLLNLGGRYEPGALAVAEHHFTTPETRSAFKVLLVKVNAHVAVDGLGAQALFGHMQRYDSESTVCGALHALLKGGEQPFLNDLRTTFNEGQDRLAALLDDNLVEARYRSLFVALVNARLQTRRVEQEIAKHEPASPTHYLVASCVTLNRPEEDTELLCGLYTADTRDASTEYRGLGDDPTKYKVLFEGSRLRVRDDHLTD
ncbi:MAG: hypothetical protein ABIG44_06205 [Planctomycetota bacterium]